MTPTEQHILDDTPVPELKPRTTGLPTLELPPAPFASRNDAASPSFIPSATPAASAAFAAPASGDAAPANPYLPPVTAGTAAPEWQHHVDGSLPELRVSASGHVEAVPKQPKSYASPWMAHPQGALDPRPIVTPAPRREHVLEPLPSVMPVLPEVGPNGIVAPAAPAAIAAADVQVQAPGPFDGIAPVVPAAGAAMPTPATAPPTPTTVAVAAAPVTAAAPGDPLLDIFNDQHAITTALANPHMWYANTAPAAPAVAPAVPVADVADPAAAAAPAPAPAPASASAPAPAPVADAPMQWNGNEDVAPAIVEPAPLPQQLSANVPVIEAHVPVIEAASPFVGIEPSTSPAYVQPAQPAADPGVPHDPMQLAQYVEASVASPAHAGVAAPARPAAARQAATAPARATVARNPAILDIEYPGSAIIWNVALGIMGLGLVSTPLLMSVDSMALLAQVAFGAATLGLLVTLAMVAHAAITAPPHLGGPIERLQSRMGLVVAAAAAHLAAANFVVGDQTIFGQVVDMLRRPDVNSLLGAIPMLAAVLPLPLLVAAWFATRNRRPASALLLVTATFLLVFSTVALRLT